MDNKHTQNKMILEHMQTIGAITQDDARELYACTRLPARINDLRSEGHKIQTIMTHGVNRFGRKISFARYILLEGSTC